MKKIAVVIPCLNEELTVGKVIADFRKVLPDADIYVIDNNSTDLTAAIALKNKAVVITEKQRGKGIAVRKAFRKIEADIYILIDGDDTYPAEEAVSLLAPILDDTADIVVGTRLSRSANSTFRIQNRLGSIFHVLCSGTSCGSVLTKWQSELSLEPELFKLSIPTQGRMCY